MSYTLYQRENTLRQWCSTFWYWGPEEWCRVDLWADSHRQGQSLGQILHRSGTCGQSMSVIQHAGSSHGPGKCAGLTPYSGFSHGVTLHSGMIWHMESCHPAGKAPPGSGNVVVKKLLLLLLTPFPCCQTFRSVGWMLLPRRLEVEHHWPCVDFSLDCIRTASGDWNTYITLSSCK